MFSNEEPSAGLRGFNAFRFCYVLRANASIHIQASGIWNDSEVRVCQCWVCVILLKVQNDSLLACCRVHWLVASGCQRQRLVYIVVGKKDRSNDNCIICVMKLFFLLFCGPLGWLGEIVVTFPQLN